MYRKTDQPELTPENFELPKETKLLADNRYRNHGRIDTGRRNLKQNMQKISRKQWVRSAKS